MPKTRRITFLLVEEFSHLAFSCAVEPLRIANLVSGEELYSWNFVSEHGEQAVCSNGSVTLVHSGLENLAKCDQLFVLSGIHMRKHVTRRLLATLRRARARGTPIGALCSGAWVLAEAGFLDGMQAAIHWEYHDAFMEAFPEVNLVRSVFVADEKHITASGGTATADLMLHLIERDHGEELAIDVADQMVYNAVRNATAKQRVSLQSRNGMRNAHLAKAINIMQDSIETPISPSFIAEELGISTRQLERLFGKYLNTSPKKYFMELRLERAQKLLLQTEASVTEIAIACGFENPGHFSRVFRSSFGVTPHAQRNKID
ncbi:MULTISPECIES: GlxA family transcriptional regulator [unclassified Ruegeria]|uniref:GlxA family transcriptional regulator n=1 Tax=unclassified Ruegeria TaxID=2625375 RepID=UPI00148793C3|nr:MULTISPECIES: GlxA family transcriptional regulator [unclassified Ruegeria]NOD35409.1 helix-turn-helix domain-containing protein [Ruegeria sp. HKCCD7296]NOD48944.1 helix-turn-helix domain-containing protein [Ruegeria sp. HKCCD5849]NOD53591.1 helix-turn-helix domain-containing protein [Ruegeria sp. HKCCD5851]NOD69466.1 helix-turn-helix domain-containing protein [Ruegeria sp. HKCCD7303]NOE32250.1 helix-turn-helix domain-containing protein [Ruegeria sp. HKCCD7318]